MLHADDDDDLLFLLMALLVVHLALLHGLGSGCAGGVLVTVSMEVVIQQHQ